MPRSRSSAYYIAPLLVEQPTWGGKYIAEHKALDAAARETKIGQAFELYDDTQVTEIPQVAGAYTYFMAAATSLKATQKYGSAQTQPLRALIEADPEGMLGKRYQAVHQNSLNTLIKFTQALNNSYQVHVKPGHEFGKWQAKPESWYYFEPGIVTLGLAPGCDVSEYHRRSLEIDAFARELSSSIQDSKITVEQARTQLQDFINLDHPHRFVNTVEIKANQVVDLGECGIHHSWEIGASAPLGNILYEVQVDVKDEFCTLRSFDQGSIKNDGSVRPLAIDEYFQALDATPEFNQPERFFRAAPTTDKGLLVPVFQTNTYHMDLLTMDSDQEAQITQNECFHHLFVQQGKTTILVGKSEYYLEKGWSLFVPAASRAYGVIAEQDARLLVTSI